MFYKKRSPRAMDGILEAYLWNYVDIILSELFIILLNSILGSFRNRFTSLSSLRSARSILDNLS
jgi:hypothetical protein